MRVKSTEDGRVAVGGGDADVIHQRIEPNVGDVIGVERNRNTPLQPVGRAGNAEVLQHVVLQKSEDPIPVDFRRNERRISLQVINQPLLVVLEFEIIVLLLQFDDLAIGRIECAIGPPILFRQKRFFPGGIESMINIPIKMPFGMEPGEKPLHDFLMPRFGGANKIIIGQFQFCREGFPTRRQVVAIGLRGFPFGEGCLLDFLTVLIQAGQEESLLSQAPARSRNHVCDKLFVSVAQVRLAVDIVNGGSDVKALAHWPYFDQPLHPWQLVRYQRRQKCLGERRSRCWVLPFREPSVL